MCQVVEEGQAAGFQTEAQIEHQDNLVDGGAFHSLHAVLVFSRLAQRMDNTRYMQFEVRED